MTRIIVKPIATLADGEIIINETIIFQGGQVIGKAVTPPALTSNTNDWDIDGLTDIVTAEIIEWSKAGFIRVSSTGNLNLTGLKEPPTSGSNPRTKLIYLKNVGSKNISLRDQSGASLAANRFNIGRHKTIQGGEGALLIYDDVDLRWSLSGINI